MIRRLHPETLNPTELLKLINLIQSVNSLIPMKNIEESIKQWFDMPNWEVWISEKEGQLVGFYVFMILQTHANLYGGFLPQITLQHRKILWNQLIELIRAHPTLTSVTTSTNEEDDINPILFEHFGFEKSQWPNISRWLNNISQTPAWKAPYDLMPGSPADRA